MQDIPELGTFSSSARKQIDIIRSNVYKTADFGNYWEDVEYAVATIITNCKLTPCNETDEYSRLLVENWVLYCSDCGGSAAQEISYIAGQSLIYCLELKNTDLLDLLRENIKRYSLSQERANETIAMLVDNNVLSKEN